MILEAVTYLYENNEETHTCYSYKELIDFMNWLIKNTLIIKNIEMKGVR